MSRFIINKYEPRWGRTIFRPAHNARFSKIGTSALLAFMVCGLHLESVAQINSIEEVTLYENGTNLTLFPDNTCRINNADKVSLPEGKNSWEVIVKKPYIETLSGLTILEQVKQQALYTRIVMDVDDDEETRLTVKYTDNVQRVSLYSVDMMHATYPDTQMLSYFMELLADIRDAKSYCYASFSP
jgi:hypothetical protein